MSNRPFFVLLALLSIFTSSLRTAFAEENLFAPTPYEFPATSFLKLESEPVIRIGLVMNASSVSIATSDTQLVAYSPEEPQRYLATNQISVSARAYRPPTYEQYLFEIQNIQNAADANEIAKEVREQTGETAQVSIDPGKNTWKVWIGAPKESKEEADAFKALLAEKGIEDVVVVTETKTVVTDDAVALSHQVRNAGKSEVRSLVKMTGGASATGSNYVDPNLREVIVNGPSESAKYSSLKSVSFGSFNDRSVPVKLNGKAYRGKLEVFVNSRGSLTVVNVVPLEDYLLGVVPAELSLPQLEAQKAQAVAARTYAVANVGGYGTKGFDMVPTVWSQVYRGVSIETPMGTRAVRDTRGIVATYQGKPIMAYFTSTCGGRTENSENIFDHGEPYLRGVECSLEGRRHFEPFFIRTVRQPAKVLDEGHLELVRLMSMFAVNGFSVDDESDEPTTGLSPNPTGGRDLKLAQSTGVEIRKVISECDKGNGETCRARARACINDLRARSTRHAPFRFGR
jgi:peptidoglycan hydrolase-like amidase